MYLFTVTAVYTSVLTFCGLDFFTVDDLETFYSTVVCHDVVRTLSSTIKRIITLARWQWIIISLDVNWPLFDGM